MDFQAVLQLFEDDVEEDDDHIHVINANNIILAQELQANVLEEEDVDVPVRNENYFEATVPRYSPDEFRSRFRMSRVTMEELVIAIGQQQHGPHTVPLRKKLMVSLWILSKKETFLDVGDRFNLSPGTVHFVFGSVINMLSRLADTYIQWPHGRERDAVAAEFQRRSQGIPGVVGAIDGCHIQIKAPVHNAHDYYNRKQIHSIVLQAVCNHRLLFTNIFVGMPGRAHDARVFRVSPLHNELNGNNPILPRHMHVIGDAAYPLLPCLMTPFRNNGHLTQQQVTYNRKLSCIRSTIERAFGMLKGKLRRLKYLDMTSTREVPSVIAAACVLHNFMLLHNEDADWWREEDLEERDSNGDSDDDDVNDNGQDNRVNNDARVKREYIMSLL